MKIAGWILLVLGSLSCIGALTAGHNISGPLFWIAIGIMLIIRSKHNKKDTH